MPDSYLPMKPDGYQPLKGYRNIEDSSAEQKDKTVQTEPGLNPTSNA
jgi:hypothetical protein